MILKKDQVRVTYELEEGSRGTVDGRNWCWGGFGDSRVLRVFNLLYSGHITETIIPFSRIIAVYRHEAAEIPSELLIP